MGRLHSHLQYGVVALAVVGMVACTTPPTVTRSPTPAGQATPPLVYLAMVDRFANGDPSNDGTVDPNDPVAFHGGDLRGIRDHLNELQQLGITTLWMTPVYAMRTTPFHGHGAFHGYWVENLERIEPRFGGDTELDALAADLRSHRMDLLLDVVLNHVGPDAPFAAEHPAFFHNNGSIEHWDNAVEVVERSVHGLPDFAQERPAVADYLIGVHKRWLERLRLRGMRIDAARHMPSAFLKQFGDVMREQAHGLGIEPFVVVGEVFEGAPHKLAQAQRDAGFDAVFDFPFHYALLDVACRGQSAGALAATVSLDRVYPRGGSALYTFADNHDVTRVLSACDGDPDKVRDALALLYLSRGTPVITWGTEVPLAGDKEPANRTSMTFDKQALRSDMIALGQLRARWSALADAPTRFLSVDDDHVVFARPVAGGSVVVLHARKPRDVSSWTTHGEPLWGAECGPPLASHVCAWFVPRSFETTRQARVVEVVVNGAFALSGGAPELGAWDPALAPRTQADGVLRFTVEAPTVLTAKLVDISGAQPQFEGGDNRILIIEPGEGPLRFTLTAR